MFRYGAAPEFARSSIVTNRAHVLLWTDSTAAYLDAIKAAGLADRVAIDTLPRKDKPSADQLARTEALMAGAVPAGLLAGMPASPPPSRIPGIGRCGRAGPAAALQCVDSDCMSPRGLLRLCRPIAGGGEGDRDAAL